MKNLKTIILLQLMLLACTAKSQLVFHRTIEKHPSSDTIVLHFNLSHFQPGEICRIQQKIPSTFTFISQDKKADTAYFDKDVATSIWLSTPKDTAISFSIRLKAPDTTHGYLYLGDCACMYGGKTTKPVRTYIPRERVYLSDTTLIPLQDSVLFTQIDSIYQKSISELKVRRKYNRNRPVLRDQYYFRIQITATKFKQEMKDIGREAIAPDVVFEEQLDHLYKYSIGNFKTYKLAQERLKLYHDRNLKGHIVAYKNGVRIGVKVVNKEMETIEAE